MANYHVVKRGSNWATMKAGSNRVSSIHRKQSTAIDRGKSLTKKTGGGELNIHNRQGQIREKNTYAKKDAFPPKG